MTVRIIDLETTGIDPSDHVVEVGSVDLLPDGSISRFQEHLIKPPCPMPAEARAVHHISDEDVAQAKSWDTVCGTPAYVPSRPGSYQLSCATASSTWLTTIRLTRQQSVQHKNFNRTTIWSIVFSATPKSSPIEPTLKIDPFRLQVATRNDSSRIL